MNIHNKIFNNIFNCESSHSAVAHSRVNLIGEHTDYTGGYVLPCLLPYKTTIFIGKNTSNKTYNAYSDFFKEKISFSNFIKSSSNKWLDYIKGCLFVIHDENRELDNTYLNILIIKVIIGNVCFRA